MTYILKFLMVQDDYWRPSYVSKFRAVGKNKEGKGKRDVCQPSPPLNESYWKSHLTYLT